MKDILKQLDEAKALLEKIREELRQEVGYSTARDSRVKARSWLDSWFGVTMVPSVIIPAHWSDQLKPQGHPVDATTGREELNPKCYRG